MHPVEDGVEQKREIKLHNLRVATSYRAIRLLTATAVKAGVAGQTIYNASLRQGTGIPFRMIPTRKTTLSRHRR